VLLGQYSEYVRVVVPKTDVRFILGGDEFYPGAGVLGRIQNRGTIGISYRPREIELESRGSAGWQKVPEESTGWSGGPALGVFIPGGVVGSCRGLRLPPTLHEGIYRVSWMVTARRKTFPVRAVFHVR
jgi:hypothetical protein